MSDTHDVPAVSDSPSYHDPSSSADITNRFRFHPADTNERIVAHERVRHLCHHLAHALDRDLPPGCEKSLALTKLEEVMFWGNAAIARRSELRK